MKIGSPLGIMVRKFAAYAPLQQDDIDALLSLPHTVKACDAATVVVRGGESRGECVVLLSGFAFRYRRAPQGARQIVAIYFPGDALNLDGLFLDNTDDNIQTMTRGDIAIIPCEALRDLALSRPAVANAMMVSTQVDGSISREWMVNVGRRAGRSRIAHFLCEFTLRRRSAGLEQGASYQLPMSQEHLADALGLTPVHVNRMLKSLEEDGLIKRDVRWITFPRWEALLEVTQFSSRYLHLKNRT